MPLQGVDMLGRKFEYDDANDQFYDRGHDDADAKVGICVYLFTTPVFLFTMFFRHDLIQCIHPGPLTFLDKVCIHQTDPVQKKRGIMKLGAYLGKSSRILVIYSDVYLQKLWTVYELACYRWRHMSQPVA